MGDFALLFYQTFLFSEAKPEFIWVSFGLANPCQGSPLNLRSTFCLVGRGTFSALQISFTLLNLKIWDLPKLRL